MKKKRLGNQTSTKKIWRLMRQLAINKHLNIHFRTSPTHCETPANTIRLLKKSLRSIAKTFSKNYLRLKLAREESQRIANDEHRNMLNNNAPPPAAYAKY